jgi:hypothetical protein
MIPLRHPPQQADGGTVRLRGQNSTSTGSIIAHNPSLTSQIASKICAAIQASLLEGATGVIQVVHISKAVFDSHLFN